MFSPQPKELTKNIIWEIIITVISEKFFKTNRFSGVKSLLSYCSIGKMSCIFEAFFSSMLKGS